RNWIGSPHTFFLPLANSAAKPSPIGVDGVMGYATAACEICDSTHTTAPEPSVVDGVPGKGACCFGWTMGSTRDTLDKGTSCCRWCMHRTTANGKQSEALMRSL